MREFDPDVDFRVIRDVAERVDVWLDVTRWMLLHLVVPGLTLYATILFWRWTGIKPLFDW